jgi:hypothetical protein
VGFSSANASVNENAGTATISVQRTGGIAGAASVDYATANGTAISGTDYTATNGTLNWMDAEAGAKTFTVAITDEAIVDGNVNFTVTLTNATGAALGATAVQTITIANDDQPPPRKRGGGGGAINWPMLLLLGVGAWRRRPRKQH